MLQCSTCDEKGIHLLSYSRRIDNIDWIGLYCDPCFVKKLRGMATTWSNK